MRLSLKCLLAAATGVTAFMITGCLSVGEDASLFNNIDELCITGINSTFDFDHLNILMITHLHRDADFGDIPSARLTQKWFRKDEQGNSVAIEKTRMTFYDVLPEGDYFARSFIDLDGDSQIDANEPYDEYTSQNGQPEVIAVRIESRWELNFGFSKTAGEY